MNQRMLLRTLSQPRPRYVIPKHATARALSQASPKHNAGAVLATAFIFWLVYFLMRQLS
jgi:hypothetical protein